MIRMKNIHFKQKKETITTLSKHTKYTIINMYMSLQSKYNDIIMNKKINNDKELVKLDKELSGCEDLSFECIYCHKNKGLVLTSSGLICSVCRMDNNVICHVCGSKKNVIMINNKLICRVCNGKN